MPTVGYNIVLIFDEESVTKINTVLSLLCGVHVGNDPVLIE